MTRFALTGLFVLAAAAFALGTSSLPAWLFAALSAISLGWRSGYRGVEAATRRVFYGALGAVVLLGWVVMVFPVLTPDTMRLWTLLIGYSVLGSGTVLLLTGLREVEPPLAAAGLLALLAFDPNREIHGFLVGAFGLALVCLGSDTVPRKGPLLLRSVSVVLFGLASFGVGAAIVQILPWTQVRLEETMMSVYTPVAGGVQSQHRARLGELQSMKLSKRIVLRVWSERPQRLRSRVLVRFDKTTWHRDPASLRTVHPARPDGLEEADRRFLEALPGLDFPVGDPPEDPRQIQTRILRVDGEGLVTPGGSLFVRAPLDTLHVDSAGVVSPPPGSRPRLYGVVHELNHQRTQSGKPSEEMLSQALQLPEDLDPRIIELSDALAAGSTDREGVIERVVSHLRQNYSYSLEVGNVDRRDPLADFLFQKKRGWCEYFAGSAAILLRVQGVPTRYVRGFNVIGSQRKHDHYVVREWDRHAWIEAFVEGKGWLEYDPTPAAEYESLHAGLGHGFLDDALSWLRVKLALVYVSLRHAEWGDVLSISLWSLAAVLSFYLLRLWSRKRRARQSESAELELEVTAPSTGLDALVGRLDRELEGLGEPRPPSRAPIEHWCSVPESKLSAQRRRAGLDLLRAYYGARFGGIAVSAEEIRRLEHAIVSDS